MPDSKEIKPILYSKGKRAEAILILHSFGIAIKETDLLFDYFKKKDFTVYRPVMPGHSGSLDDLKKFGPADWLVEARTALEKLSKESDRIIVMGVSFGSNIAVSLCAEDHPQIKGLVITEMPLFFRLKIALVLYLIQPIYQLLGIDFISKNSRLYRKNRLQREGSFAFVPVKVSGQIRRYVKNVTRLELAKLAIPVFVMYAKSSDLVNSRKIVKFICKNIKPGQLELCSVNTDNHDLNVLDEPGRVLLLDKILAFINKL